MNKSKLLTGALSIALAVTMMTTPALAAENQNVKATQSGGVTVTYQGREQAFTDANNANVLPIIYDGTTYLPVRAVANLAGLGVGWDGETSTVSLTTKGQQKSYDGDFNAGNADVDVTISKGMTVTLDGAVKSFTDANGTAVYPITFNGTTYLPVRAVCGLVNMDVDWDQASSTVKLGALPAGSVVINDLSGLYAPGSTTMDIDRGKIHTNPNAVSYGFCKFSVDTSGYSTLTLTVEAGDQDVMVCFGARTPDMGKYENGIALPCEVVAANTTRTISVSCVGYSRIIPGFVKPENGASFREAWVSNITLTP